MQWFLFIFTKVATETLFDVKIKTKFVNRYYVDQMANGKGFIVDVKIKICLPIDSEVYCIPQNGFHLLQRQQFPVCAKDFFDWMKGMIIIYHIFCKNL